jgi:prepilin-type N-terminal cleavage/methylation domain-containing protein
MNPRNFRGYTLIEIVLVTAIIGILVSVAIASFSPNQKKIDYRKVAESLTQHIAYAQQIAQTENKYASLIANSTAKTYSLRLSPTDGGDPEVIPLWFENAFINTVNLSSFTSTLGFGANDTITFTPWGLLESSDDILIDLEGTNLNVSGLTGVTSFAN